MVKDVVESGEVRVFGGSSHPDLATEIADYLGVPLDPTEVSRFSNDNLYIQLGASVRARTVFIVQSLSPPVNDHLVELLIMLDAARSASAREIHAIIPYFSFARSDKKDAPRISITAWLVADLLTNTVHLPPEKRHPKLSVLSVADVFGEAIRRNFLRQSIGICLRLEKRLLKEYTSGINMTPPSPQMAGDGGVVTQPLFHA